MAPGSGAIALTAMSNVKPAAALHLPDRAVAVVYAYESGLVTPGES